MDQLPPPPQAPKPAPPPIWKRWWFWAGAFVIVIAVGAVAGGSGSGENDTAAAESPSPTVEESPSPTEAESPSPAEEESTSATETASPEPAGEPTEEPEPAGNTFGDGTWVVGSDIKPGTYRAADAGNGCYWQRLKNFSGSFGAIIANGNGIGGPLIVTIEKTDEGFSSEDCGDWSDDLSPVTSSRNAFSDGTYPVGVDISPGTYRVNARNGCYWERLRNFTAEFDGIIANDNARGSTIVEISSSDAGFSSQDCGDWEKV